MTSATTAMAESEAEETGLDTAFRLLWLAVIFDLFAFGLGFEGTGAGTPRTRSKTSSRRRTYSSTRCTSARR